MTIELFNDSLQNYKVYGIPKAQLILTDVPYVLGNKAYASNPSWYVELLLPLLPKFVDSSRHSPKTCNARRLIGRELERAKKILENENHD